MGFTVPRLPPPEILPELDVPPLETVVFFGADAVSVAAAVAVPVDLFGAAEVFDFPVILFGDGAESKSAYAHNQFRRNVFPFGSHWLLCRCRI